MNKIKLPKTQRLIRTTFLDLLTEKDFNQLRVTDIITRAEISRSTFYQYYDDKYQLLEEIETELIDGFIKLMLIIRQNGIADFTKQVKCGCHPIYVEYFKYIRAHCEIFHVLLDYKSGTYFSHKFMNAISATRLETSKNWISEVSQTNDRELREYREALLASIYVTLFTTWLKNDMNFSEEKMASILCSMWQAEILYTDLLFRHA